MLNNAKRRILVYITVLILFLSLSEAKRDDTGRIRGVEESKEHLYKPKGATWACLDGSKTIPASAINDDYCDCPDGSDEPGTSACPNGLFYCANAGHMPTRISASLVDDGLCDPECCDGSDESLITCPNICEQVGLEYRRQVNEIKILQEKGAKKKRELITLGKMAKEKRLAEKKDIESKLDSMRANIEELRKAKDALEARKETVREEAKSRVGYVPAAPSVPSRCKCPRRSTDSRKFANVRETLRNLLEHTDNLVYILRALKNDHNPNYNDMAVKHAIEAYDGFIKEWEPDEDDENGAGGYREDVKATIDDDSDDDTLKLEDTLTQEEGEDVESTDSSDDEENALKDDTEYQKFKEGNPSIFAKFGAFISRSVSPLAHFFRTDRESKDLTRARDAFTDAEVALHDAERHLRELNEKLEKDYGPDEEWEQLDGTCIERNEGEYTYKVCFLDNAEQRSQRDHSGTNLGSFSRWDGPGDNGVASKYTVQVYDRGQKCWNGPERSVHLTLECGEDNEILSVTEPAKCEYAFRVRSPAACPLEIPEDFNEGISPKKPVHGEL